LASPANTPSTIGATSRSAACDPSRRLAKSQTLSSPPPTRAGIHGSRSRRRIARGSRIPDRAKRTGCADTSRIRPPRTRKRWAAAPSLGSRSRSRPAILISRSIAGSGSRNPVGPVSTVQSPSTLVRALPPTEGARSSTTISTPSPARRDARSPKRSAAACAAARPEMPAPTTTRRFTPSLPSREEKCAIASHRLAAPPVEALGQLARGEPAGRQHVDAPRRDPHPSLLRIWRQPRQLVGEVVGELDAQRSGDLLRIDPPMTEEVVEDPAPDLVVTIAHEAPRDRQTPIDQRGFVMVEARLVLKRRAGNVARRSGADADDVGGVGRGIAADRAAQGSRRSGRRQQVV